MTRNCCVAVLCALGLLSPSVVQAQSTLNVGITNLDLVFEGVQGQLGTDDPDSIGSIDIEVDQQTDTLLFNPSGLFTELTITGLGEQLDSGVLIIETPVQGALSFGTQADGFLVELTFTDLDYLVVPSPVGGANLFTFSARATVASQVMPNGLLFGSDQVLISYTASDANLDTTPTGVSGLTSSGQVTITGPLIPEPGSFALLALGGVAVALRRRRA